MSKQGVFIRYWLPVLVWAAIIFWGSTDAMSDRRTSRLIGPILRWLVPGISDENVDWIQLGIRKAGHLVAFGVLAILSCRALRGGRVKGWSWREAGWAFLATVLYAISDELHQATVPSRFASAGDVLLDTCGAALGLALYRCFDWLRTRTRR